MAVSALFNARVSGGHSPPLTHVVRLHMCDEHQEPPEPTNRRVGWSIYGASMLAACLVCAGLAPWGLIPVLSGGAWFGVAIALGAATALALNLLRPRYENAVGKWRSFYDFLLRQMPPPD